MLYKIGKINIMITSFRNLSYKHVFNLFICFLPISFIAGNLIINFNVILIIIFSILIFKKSFFLFKLNLIEKLLLCLFSYAFFISSYNFFIFPEQNNIYAKENFIKGMAFLRYLLFYISIKLLIVNKIISFKNFFFVASSAVLFVSLDIFYQLIFGVDIFGNLKTHPYKLSGPFGSEQIAGSYLQRFSMFLFFLIPVVLNFKNKSNLIFFLSCFFILVFSAMILTGNRMPVILFILMFSFLFFMEKKLWKYALFFLFLFFTSFLIIFYFNQYVQQFTYYFIRMSLDIFVFLKNVIILGNEPALTNTYIKEFYSGYIAWKENIIFGGGINSFYLNCSKTLPWCASHPHNYYIEILSELGVVGLILIIIIVFNLFTNFFNNKNDLSLEFEKNIIIPFALLLAVEFFPIKTSGSFFTTGNTTFIFLLIAIVANLPKKYIQIE